MAPALIALAAQIGAPLVERILTGRIGGGDAALAGDVMRAIARRLHVAPEAIEGLVETEPARVIDAVREVERTAPELITIYAAEVANAASLARDEADGPLWMRAWRPGGMYLIGLLWLWNVVLLHVANAIWRTALPPVPFEQLMQLSGLYFALYMGGHTIKDLAARWVEKS
jgi:hypothetical protein